MLEFFSQFHPVMQAFIASFYAWFMTALGAASVFAFSKLQKKMLDGFLGFAAGIMIAASFFSLLLPAIEMSSHFGMPKWLVPCLGFLSGGVFLRMVDMVLPHLHPHIGKTEVLEGFYEEGIKTSWHRSTLLVLTLTLHNIPEGLAIGIAFGAAASGMPGTTLAGALALAVGIGIQDYPEGFSVAIPLRKLGKSLRQSFFYGALSGIVEPIGAVIGCLAVMMIQPIMPFALSFAAGAMIFITVEEVIPESQSAGNAHYATTGIMMGFALMMILETIFAV